VKNPDVQVLLRQILQASLAAPLAFTACGGQAAGDAAAGNPGHDAGTSEAGDDSRGAPDARTDDGAASSDSANVSDSANAADATEAGAGDAGYQDATSATDAGGSDGRAGDASDDAIADVYVPNGCSTTGSPPVQCDAAGICGGTCQTFSFPLLGDPSVCGLVARSGPLCGSSNSAALCAALCHTSAACFLDQTTDENRVTCQIGICCTGRRPQGLALDAAQGTPLGRWFADMAALEAASVDAFAVLRDELRAHGAPKRLLRGVARAERDEVRHARVTGALARRYGSRPGKPRVERGEVRSLEAIARENAVEGCVRETYGALVGMWQARFARDRHVRGVMDRIAVDEARHAALSWDIARWAEARLDLDARGRVQRAREVAVAQLEAQIDREPTQELVRDAGVPSAAAARVLLEEARRQLWS
jgi:hypothetical protein